MLYNLIGDIHGRDADFDVYKPHIAPTIVPYQALVLNIPHASTEIPKEYMPPQEWHKKENSVRRYQEHARPLIDYYTDELFFVDDKRIKPVVFDLCRTLCDVERMVNDPLEEDGYGIVCSKVMRHDPGATKCSVDYDPAPFSGCCATGRADGAIGYSRV